MPIKLNTASGGGVILTGANTASDKTITVPADDGTMIYANSSGNVGIGTSSPTVKLQINQTTTGTYFRANASTADRPLMFTSSTTINNGDTHTLKVDSSTGILAFAIDATERARIDASGTLFVGGTANPGPLISRVITVANGLNGVEHFLCNEQRATAGTENYFRFYRNNSLVGSITNTLSNTAYNTSSDYRLKENVQPMTGALAKIAALKPCTYTWKVDGSDGEGFIAHELAEVVPGCVTGEKDAVDAEGKPIYQGIDTSFLVATLTAAIQEQQQMIETLQAKVAALEAK